MTKIRTGKYLYKGFTVERVELNAVGASPASVVWNIIDEDNYTIEAFDTKRDCKICIDNMEGEN